MKPIFLFGLIIFFFSASLCAQTADSLIYKKDSLKALPAAGYADSLKSAISAKPLANLKNKLLNSDAEPVSMAVKLRKEKSDDLYFYLMAFIVLLMAFLKYSYSRYFTNLFRLFFNTSLRQSQITDQLLQAKLPSFLFNIFFVISGGIYVYILLFNYGLFNADNQWKIIFSSIAMMGLVYFIKFCSLKFTGWVTGLGEAVNIYVFIIFLINKITGIILVPFIIILSFTETEIAKIAALISLITLGVFLFLRFFKTYGLIQNLLKISRFHFFLYILGLEILPLLLIYKGLMIYLTKNL